MQKMLQYENMINLEFNFLYNIPVVCTLYDMMLIYIYIGS